MCCPVAHRPSPARPSIATIAPHASAGGLLVTSVRDVLSVVAVGVEHLRLLAVALTKKSLLPQHHKRRRKDNDTTMISFLVRYIYIFFLK